MNLASAVSTASARSWPEIAVWCIRNGGEQLTANQRTFLINMTSTTCRRPTKRQQEYLGELFNRLNYAQKETRRPWRRDGLR